MSTRAELKAFFQTGDVPTEAQFADLINSLAHASEDGLATDAEVSGAITALSTVYQPILVAGNNIKTINGVSPLGSGNIVISGGGGTVDTTIIDGSANAVSGNAVHDALALKANLASPQITGDWRLDTNYFVNQDGLRRIMFTTGFPGVGLYNFGGNFVGGLTAGNAGTFNLEFPGGTRVVLAAVAGFDRYVANDINGGAAFAPQFAMDVTNSFEGGFYCPKSGGNAADQIWVSSRTNRVSLSRAGRLEFLVGTTVVLNPAASVTPTANGNLVVEATSNTSLTFKLRGSDGVVRSGSIPLS